MLNLQRLHYKYYEMLIKAPFGSCKSISRKYSIFQKCYFSERKMFSCVWLHFKKMFRKIFSNVWLCYWKYHKKHIFYLLHTFSTCSTHFLLVAHIFSVAKRIYNIIHSSKHKRNPEKNHQIRTLRTIAIGAKAKSRRSRRMISAIEASDDLGELGFGRSLLSLLSFSLSLFLLLSLSFARDPEMVWR